MGLLAVTSLHFLFSVPLALISIFLILLILVQRGRGGGLTGALGGMGGQSAFGTKAGDLFTRITIVGAAVWILLSMGALKILSQSAATGGLKAESKSAPVVPGKQGDSPLQPAPTTEGTLGEPAASPAADEKAAPAETPAAPAETPAAAEKAAPAETPAPAAAEKAAPAEESKGK